MEAASPYATFIAAAYGASAFGFFALVAWVWLAHRTRTRQLDRLEKSGFGRTATPEDAG